MLYKFAICYVKTPSCGPVFNLFLYYGIDTLFHNNYLIGVSRRSREYFTYAVAANIIMGGNRQCPGGGTNDHSQVSGGLPI